MLKGRGERKIKKKSILFVVIAVILGLGLIAIPSLAIADDQGVEVISAPIDEVSPQIPTDQFDVTAVMVALNNPNYPDFLGGTGNPIGVSFPPSALSAGTRVLTVALGFCT